MTDTQVTNEPPAPPATEGQPQPQDPSAATLAELGITPDENGRISLADHQKLLSTLGTLREQTRKSEAAAEKARLAAMGEQERAVEEARKAGYEAATSEQRVATTSAQVVAAATIASFSDPKDALLHIDVASLADEAAITEAIAKLAKDKPYLLKGAIAPKIEQGPQGVAGKGSSTGDWLGDAMRKRLGG